MTIEIRKSANRCIGCKFEESRSKSVEENMEILISRPPDVYWMYITLCKKCRTELFEKLKSLGEE